MAGNNIEKAVVILSGNYVLQQFLWFYSSLKDTYQWTAVIPFADKSGELSKSMEEQCKTSGIFKKIIVLNESPMDYSLVTKARQFASMFFYKLAGKKSKYCSNLIHSSIGSIEYDLWVVPYDYSLLAGALVACSSFFNIIILEDGLADYQIRRSSYDWAYKLDFNQITGFLLAKLGYSNPTSKYKFEATKYCIKYSVAPESMLYREYKEIKKLFDMSNCDRKLYESLVKALYLKNVKIAYSDIDLVIMTTPMIDFTHDQHYYEQFHQYLLDNYADFRILLKMHPRDTYSYNWNDLNIVQTIGKEIPVEVLSSLLLNKDYVSMFPSTAFIQILNSNCRCSCVYFEKLAASNKSYKQNFNIAIEALKSMSLPPLTIDSIC